MILIKTIRQFFIRCIFTEAQRGTICSTLGTEIEAQADHIVNGAETLMEIQEAKDYILDMEVICHMLE